MNNIDKRGKLEEQFFSYKIVKDNKVFIYWYEKEVKVLTGNKALKFIEDIEGADYKEEQLIMARLTGNFKRGNEKNKGKRN